MPNFSFKLRVRGSASIGVQNDPAARWIRVEASDDNRDSNSGNNVLTIKEKIIEFLTKDPALGFPDWFVTVELFSALASPEIWVICYGGINDAVLLHHATGMLRVEPGVTTGVFLP